MLRDKHVIRDPHQRRTVTRAHHTHDFREGRCLCGEKPRKPVTARR